MTELLLAALGHLPPRVRRAAVAIGALLALGAVTAALTLTNPDREHKARASARRPASAGPSHPSPRRLRPPASTATMLRVRQAAARYLVGYLRFAYGRGSALAIRGITLDPRRELLRQHARLTPAERRRRPRVMSLQTIATTPTFVVATALIDDGGVTTYRLRFTLERGAGGWAVSSVEDG